MPGYSHEEGNQLTYVPTDVIQIPNPTTFEEAKFVLSQNLANAADRLIDKHGFTHIRQASVDYLWRGKGSTRGGKLVLGKTQRPSGLLKLYSKADFVIILAADHCRNQKLDEDQLEALLFHELLHIGSDDEGEPTLVAHDVEAFVEEIKEYGLWKSDLKLLRAVKKQIAGAEDGN